MGHRKTNYAIYQICEYLKDKGEISLKDIAEHFEYDDEIEFKESLPIGHGLYCDFFSINENCYDFYSTRTYNAYSIKLLKKGEYFLKNYKRNKYKSIVVKTTIIPLKKSFCWFIRLIENNAKVSISVSGAGVFMIIIKLIDVLFNK